LSLLCARSHRHAHSVPTRRSSDLAPTNARGGVNPMQVGLGSQVGSIDNTHGQGFRQSTDRPLDFAIEGNGMFVVHDGKIKWSIRSEEHTSELQSRFDLVCRLLLEK